VPDNIIQVPRPAATAFNKNRPLAGNTLLQSQVAHFMAVDRDLPAEQRTGIEAGSIQTEGQAGEYIRRMTAILHPQGARKERVRRAT